MSRLTLLEMTQNILSAMDSDEVNSIFDTVESQQVATVIKETYYDLFSTTSIPEHSGFIRLEGLGDTDRPNYLRIPTNVLSIDWIKYRDEQSGQFRDLNYLQPEDFLRRVLLNVSNTVDVETVTDESGVMFYVKNNSQPSVYTIINDKYIVTDAYNADYDSTLQASKTFAWGDVEETWEMDDSFIPNLDNDLFPLLLSEAKSVCFITLKQQANQKEEQRARKHRVHLQYRKWKDKTERKSNWQGTNYARNR